MIDKEKLKAKREKEAEESVDLWTSFLSEDTKDESKPDNKNPKKA